MLYQPAPYVRVIAEAGVNHNGNVSLAIELIDAAAESGADIVKFQTFKTSSLTTENAPMAKYQEINTQTQNTQQAMLQKLELPLDDFYTLAQHAKEKGIQFLSTPFDLESISFLQKMKLNTVKIGSGEITNLPYLRRIAKFKWDIFLSTGMSSLDEVQDALNALIKSGVNESSITLFHCTTEYPAPVQDVNLRAMLTLKDKFSNIAGIGYSDHTKGITIPIAAVSLGATVIEKHFTLDKKMDGPDHKASLEPHELKQMVQAIRDVSSSLGNGIKEPAPSEIPNRTVARKSIVAARDILAGELLTEENLTTKRPGNGISPMCWDDIIGTAAPRNFKKDELL